MKIKTLLKSALVSKELEAHVDSMPTSAGSTGYDPWGFNVESAKIGLALLKFFYDHYFRVEAHGLENVPARGGVLLIGNHSGQLPTDGMMIGVAIATNGARPRAPRAMVERFAFNFPYVGNMLAQVGSVVGDPGNCKRMLEHGEAVIVFPEGAKGGGKLYSKRYQLQHFGNGFMHLAIATKCPIVPVGIVGGEETMPALANIKPLARILGMPSFPLTVPFPLPAKMILNFGKPMRFTGDIESESMVTENVEKVKTEIRRLMDKGLSERESVY